MESSCHSVWAASARSIVRSIPASTGRSPSRSSKGVGAVSDQLRQRFEREARLVSRLTHPNICALYDVGRQNGFDFFVMEYVEGETLAARLERRSLPVNEGLQAMAEVADAIACAHRSGVIHRDLTPEQHHADAFGRQAAGFRPGHAHGLPPAGSRRRRCRGGIYVPGSDWRPFRPGNAAVMAPEQLQGREADTRSDIFAFGSVLYEW